MEDEILSPVIGEVFSYEEKISDYIQEQHNELKEKLKNVVLNFDTQIQNGDNLYQCMEDLLVNMYQENLLVYPMVEQYVKLHPHEMRKTG